MRKNLLYLCTLVCMVGLFAVGCSKDDNVANNKWEDLPSGQIAVEKVTLSVNGEATSGNVVFKALNASNAQIQLKNVIDGYDDVTLDAKLIEQTDGSFKLSAVKDIETKPSTRAASAMLTVNVDGNVTADGRFTLSISAEGPGLFIGTYSGENLVLTYSDEALAGYEVVFDGTKGDNVTIALKNIIPGEEETVLKDIAYAGGKFSGKTATEYAEVEYSGSRADKVLTLALKVKMNDPSGWAGTYGLSDYTQGHWEYEEEGLVSEECVLGGAMYMDWTYTPDPEAETNPKGSQVLANLLRGFGSIVLPQVLQTVTIEADGNIVARYVEKPNILFNMDWIAPAMGEMKFPTKAALGENWIPVAGWATSPKHLATWFEKDGKFYIKLDIKNIINTAMPGEPAMADAILQVLNNSTVAEIKELASAVGFDLSKVSDVSIEQILGWVKNGIPMVVEKKEGARTCISLDKTAFDNLFASRPGEYYPTSDITELWNAAVAAGFIPEEASMAGIFLTLFSTYWPATITFNLGLDLQEM